MAERYRPEVSVEALETLPEDYDENKLEPTVFVLQHPVMLKAVDGKTYYWPKDTVIVEVGRAYKEGGN